MSDSNRSDHTGIIVAAFVTFLLIFSLIGYFQGLEKGHTDRAEVDAKKHHENAAEYVEGSCVGRDHAAFVECVDKAIKTSGEYQRAEHDLAAQQQMAQFAKWLLAVTLLTTGVTGVGVYYVKRTLDQTAATNSAALAAAVAAGEANQIMRDQSAGYLVIDSVQMQVQGRILLIQAHVRNIGQRPVRRGKVKGLVTFRWPSIGENGVLKFHSAIARFDVWVGVVEAGCAARGLDGISFSKFFDEPNKFDAHIVGNKDADVDCKITWADSLQANSGERHILSKSGAESALDIAKGDIIELKVAYSGLSKDWEERGED